MSDLIYRDQAIEAISKLPVKVDNLGYTWMIAGDALKQLDDIPPAEPERKKGKWLFHIDDLFPEESTQECSICHAEESIKIQNDNFCPNCGAEMRGER